MRSFFPGHMLKKYDTIPDLQHVLAYQRENKKSIGFVPTMGALHQGHLSLIEACNNACNASVASIFVNPTQFNDPEDYKKYPKDNPIDWHMLEEAGCDFLFSPSVPEMYPDESTKKIDFDPGTLGERLEGASRPGHFKGMAVVVKRLFDIVMPDKAFFGQKDYQQYLIVKNMVAHFEMPIEVVKCPIIREPNGLAMSSRNERLSPEIRQGAGIIYKTLTKAAQQVRDNSISFDQIMHEGKMVLEGLGNFTVDYFDICSAIDLKPAHQNGPDDELIVLTAVYADGVRLIDNVLV